MIDRRERLGHVKGQHLKTGSFHSFDWRTGRDQHEPPKRVQRPPRKEGRRAPKGSHPGPDGIRLTERYQNILRDNERDDYLDQFRYEGSRGSRR